MTARRLTMLCTVAAATLPLLAGGLEAGRGGGARGGRGARRGLEMRGRPGSRGGRGPGLAGPMGRYDRASETAISGVAVDTPGQGGGRGQAGGMTVRTESGELRRVRLGPPWYVETLGLSPMPGDHVEVIGAAPRGAGQGEIVAREVRWRGHVFRFRARRGGPLWSGASHRGWQRYGGLWNRDRSQRVIGEIESVEQFWPGGPGMGPGIGLRVRTREQERIRVHLGPSWFVEEELPDLRPGQQVTVVGAPAEWGGEEVLLSSELERDGESLALRDEQGRPAWRGGWQDWGGWGPGSRYGRRYDASTMETITGRVESADQGPPDTGLGPGGLIAVRTEDGRLVRAHLAPMWFMQQSDLNLKPGDEVTLEGSIVGAGDDRAMMVRTITAPGLEMELRDDDGVPVWAATRPRSDTRRGDPPMAR